MDQGPEETVQEAMPTDPSVILKLALALLIASPIPGAPAQTELAHLNWGLRYSDACREALFGDSEDYRRSGGEGTVVVLRYSDLSELETQVVLDGSSTDSPVIGVTSIIGQSLVDQLAALHRKTPGISPDEACRRVRSKSFSRTDAGAEQALDELRAISMSPVLSAPFVIHGTSYEIWIFSAATESHFEFLGPTPAELLAHPLAQWSNKVLALATDSQRSASTP